MESKFSLAAFRFFLSGNPWLRLVLPFGSGIALASYVPPGSSFFYKEMYGLLIFLLLAYLLTLYDKNGLGLKKWISGSIALLFLCCAGFQLARAATSLHFPEHFSRHFWSALYVQVNSIPEKRGKFIRFEGRVLLGKPKGPAQRKDIPPATNGACPAVNDPAVNGPAVNDPAVKETKGQLLVYLRPKDGVRLQYGDQLWIAPVFQDVPPPRNPAAFDFKAYLAARDIYQQAFLTSDQWQSAGRNSGNPLIRWASVLQKHCVEAFERLLPDKENAALLSAFVLGFRAGIERDTMNAFADTGTIHILSVSGLHVAILYWLLNLLLKPLGALPGGKLPQLLLLICGIWFYAFITGLSPPVCRAAWMIILYAIARFLGREHKAGNVVALTAFLLLASNPLVLNDVGFQLSFLAVAGLIFFYPRLASLYSPGLHAQGLHAQGLHSPEELAPKYRSGAHMNGHRDRKYRRLVHHYWQRILKYLLSMTAVSLSAQLATFPLAVFYFHQFPVYFLPANLILIPLASLILYGGILLLVISAAGAAALFLAAQLSLLIDGMKGGMYFFSRLPGAVLDGLWITPPECLGLYLLILSGAVFILSRKAASLITALCIALALALSFATEAFRQAEQRIFVFFNTSDRPAIAFISGKAAVLLMENPIPQQVYEYSVQPFLDKSGSRIIYTGKPGGDKPGNPGDGQGGDLRKPFLAKSGPYLQFFNLRILLIDDEFKYPRPRDKLLPCDFLLITENTYLQMEKLSQAFRVKMLVSGAGVSNALNRYLERYCRSRRIPFYSVRKSGAFVTHLSGIVRKQAKKPERK